MTPKEKAIELYNKTDLTIYTNQDWKSRCIICAIRAINEVEEILDTYKSETNFVDNERYEFWQNVKLEIIKLQINFLTIEEAIDHLYELLKK